MDFFLSSTRDRRTRFSNADWPEAQPYFLSNWVRYQTSRELTVHLRGDAFRLAGNCSSERRFSGKSAPPHPASQAQFRSQSATVFASKRTHVPMRNEGMRPAFACLKIVIRETASTFASSSAVNAWPVRSIWSANVMGVETSEDGMVLPKQRDLCFLGGLSRMGERKPCLGSRLRAALPAVLHR